MAAQGMPTDTPLAVRLVAVQAMVSDRAVVSARATSWMPDCSKSETITPGTAAVAAPAEVGAPTVATRADRQRGSR